MVNSLLRFFLSAVLLIGAVFSAAASTPLRVGVYGMEPFAKQDGGLWTGLSIDIWEKVAEINKWEYDYHAYTDVDSAIAALRKGEVDIVVSPVPITGEAVKQVEFSQPYFRSGLHIMVSEARKNTVMGLLENVGGWLVLPLFWVIVGAVLAMTVVVALFEWKHNPDFPKGRAEGLVEAFYYVVSLTLTGKSTYKGFPGILGRLVLVVWMILGLFMVIFLTSSVTATLTAERLQGHINGPKDLMGKTVGAIKATRAVEYLREHEIDTILYPNIEDAAQALIADKVRAIVGPAPALQYYDNNNPNLPITEVGHVFNPYNYGFAFPVGSDRRLEVNAALLKLQESGMITDQARKYFGSVYQP